MRVIAVTSEVTYAPENYNTVILGLSEITEVYALVVVRNRRWKMLREAWEAIRSGAAPALGWQTVKNFINPGNLARRRAYRQQTKRIYYVDKLDSPVTEKLFHSLSADLILLLRAPEHFPDNLRRLPRLGTLALHYGLLPEQQGWMCDFWSHRHQTPSGFTLHERKNHFSQGPILRRVEVTRSQTSYLEYLERSNIMELAMLHSFLSELRSQAKWVGAPILQTRPTQVNPKPNLVDFQELRKLGVGI